MIHNILEKEIGCPMCVGIAYLYKKKCKFKNKNKIVFIKVGYYKCNKCNLEFTTTESDNEWLNKLLGIH